MTHRSAGSSCPKTSAFAFSHFERVKSSNNKGISEDVWLTSFWCIITLLDFLVLIFVLSLVFSITASSALTMLMIQKLYFYFWSNLTLSIDFFFLSLDSVPKTWPAWVIEAFMHLHTRHSLGISSVGPGFPTNCAYARRRTNRMFTTQDWTNASDSSLFVIFIYNLALAWLVYCFVFTFPRYNMFE